MLIIEIVFLFFYWPIFLPYCRLSMGWKLSKSTVRDVWVPGKNNNAHIWKTVVLFTWNWPLFNTPNSGATATLKKPQWGSESQIREFTWLIYLTLLQIFSLSPFGFWNVWLCVLSFVCLFFFQSDLFVFSELPTNVSLGLDHNAFGNTFWNVFLTLKTSRQRKKHC